MPGQPHREFDPLKLEQFTASVRERGVLQPILVRPVVGR
ncbi:ParB N-terminal domain-containing protein [Deinococcus budaensis]